MYSLLHSILPRAGLQAHATIRPLSLSLRAYTQHASSHDPNREAYDALCMHLRETERLAGIEGALEWDSHVMLPPGAAQARAQQKAALAAVLHDRQTSKELGRLLESVKSTSELNEYERAVVRDARRDFVMHTRMDRDLASRLSKIQAEAYHIWAEAKSKNDFGLFAPTLSKLMDVTREVASKTRPHLSVYDACLDMFERGMTVQRLQTVFGQLKVDLPPLIAAAVAKQATNQMPDCLKGGPQWNVEAQKTFCKEVAELIGFDFDRGRLDTSLHPFTGGSGPSDVRITTRYGTNPPLEGLMATIHEVGHALYEQGRNQTYADLPVSRALSMGSHESQSLFWERMIGQSKPFWQFLTPKMAKHFPFLETVTWSDLYRLVNQVKPGLIRVNADEITYPMHIVMRFEIERGLVEGTIRVENLPGIWNEKMDKYVGVVPNTNAEGCLQDVHWAVGAIGYFPSYTLGAMSACQLHHAASNQIPSFDTKVGNGELTPIRDWLRVNVHEVGSLHTSLDDLLISATGEPLNPAYFISHLKAKYAQ
eukprot:comp21313_c0_seq1/m.29164 comp21313_c0_seq1/g.29164  ORF comp21313_c0_seq1/g.29164 comp21313_c0_seq1/m.29164 type:complete len:537 (-) comp21313_c0_seq1:641-2251(-)